MMQIDKCFSYRKTITPWYDSDFICAIKLLIIFIIVLFGADGIKVAKQSDAYNEYVWVPLLLFALSVVVFATNIIRLVKR